MALGSKFVKSTGLAKSVGSAVIGSIFLALSLWSAPRLLALYHQEQGARLIIRALQAEGRAEAGDFWLEPAPLTQPEAQSLAEEALAHFEAAIAAAPYNFQARRWLGRTGLLLNRPIDAVTTLSDAVRQRARNPLGWWDLGLAYERLAPLSKEPSAGTLAVEVDNFTDDVMIISGLVTATLDTIMSETPAIPIETPYCNQGTAPQSCFMAPTVWEMPDAPQEQFWTPAEAIRRTVLFMHPPAQSTLTVTLPMTPTTLLFWLGMDPAAWAWLGDGVIYRLQVNGQPVFEQALTPAEAIAGWQPGQVDLTPWVGQTIRLTLATDAGPAGDGTGDWAGWGDVQGVPLDVAPCLRLSCRDRATAAWKEGGFTAQDFIQAGEVARKGERYEEALRWYGRAARVEPGLVDPWYYTGLTYEGMERWAEALVAYEQAVVRNSFASVHRSSLYYQIGMIYQWRLESREIEQALAQYEVAITINDFNTNWEAADCHYKRGEILWWLGKDPNDSITEYRQAIELNPNHASAHVLLGMAYYIRDKDVYRAEAEIQKALELSPQNKWAYYYLGEIYRQEGDIVKARTMYKKALEIDPEFEAAQNKLQVPADSK